MLSKQIKYPIIQYKKLFLKQKIFSQIVILRKMTVDALNVRT